MKQKIIACESIKEELLLLAPEAEMEFLDYNLHSKPEELNLALKQMVKQETEADSILLGYGLCSNAVVGICSDKQRLVIPCVHDCIAMLMGSAGKYSEAFTESPETFYLSRGWIDYGSDPMKELHQYAKKYGEDNAKWVINEMYKNYHKIVMIDTGVCEQKHFDYAKKAADFMNWSYEEISGSLSLLKKLVNGDWDEDFLVIEPGQCIEQQSFLCRGCNSGIIE